MEFCICFIIGLFGKKLIEKDTTWSFCWFFPKINRFEMINTISKYYLHCFFIVIYFLPFSYNILCPKILATISDPKKSAAEIVNSVSLEADLYRLGNTKACS